MHLYMERLSQRLSQRFIHGKALSKTLPKTVSKTLSKAPSKTMSKIVQIVYIRARIHTTAPRLYILFLIQYVFRLGATNNGV